MKKLAVYKYCVNKYDIAIFNQIFFKHFFLDSLFKIYVFLQLFVPIGCVYNDSGSHGIKANVILMFKKYKKRWDNIWSVREYANNAKINTIGYAGYWMPCEWEERVDFLNNL